MPCFHPLKAYRSRERNPETGRYLLTFNPHNSLIEGSSVTLPCGKCSGCRVDKAKEWAARCMHEAKMHQHNGFLTLTYNDQNMPESGSVDLRELQLFMKRLRKQAGYPNLRFFSCGEYSPNNKRPHYHLLIFNHRFPDLKLFSDQNKTQLFTSLKLQQIWPYGFSTVGQLNYQSAAYVARYTLKKITGPQAAEHYTWPHPVTGKLVRVQPEFITMSKKPGLGTAWFDQFKGDCYPDDFIIVDGKRHKVPKFYDKKLKLERERELELLKRKRAIAGHARKEDNTKERLKVREEVLDARLKQLKRTL